MSATSQEGQVGSKNGSDPKHVLIPNNVLKAALDEELEGLGPTFRGVVNENLARGGIDLRGTGLQYSLSDLEEQLSLLIGDGPAKVLLERISRNLNKSER